MQYEMVPGSSSSRWVSYDPDYQLESLLDHFLDAQLTLADLDGTLGPCQGTRIVSRNLWETRSGLLAIAADVARLGIVGDDFKLDAWERYSSRHMPDGSRLQTKVVEEYTPNFARTQLFKGVYDVHQLLGGHKEIVTQNSAVVAYAFSCALGYDKYRTMVPDKAVVAEQIFDRQLRQQNAIQKVTVVGNSMKDAVMVPVLEAKGAQTVGIYCATGRRPETRMFGWFGMQVSAHDQSLFAELLRQRKEQREGY